MKCPYRKRVRISPDGVSRVTEVDFMECIKEECPYWGAKVLSADEYGFKWAYGCGKAKKECS